MNNNTLLIVLAFLLGLFLSGIMKNLCGCQLVEGLPEHCIVADNNGIMQCQETNDGDEIKIRQCPNYEQVKPDETLEQTTFQDCVIPKPSQEEHNSLLYFNNNDPQNNITIDDINDLVNGIMSILRQYLNWNQRPYDGSQDEKDFLELISSIGTKPAAFINFFNKINIIKVYSKKMADENDRLYNFVNSGLGKNFALSSELSEKLNEINIKILEAECFTPEWARHLKKVAPQEWKLDEEKKLWAC